MGAEAAVIALERQEWLDPVAEPVQSTILGLFDASGRVGQRVKNFLHGTWLGHPLHPVLTDVPLGAWTVAAVLDVMESLNRRRRPDRAADRAVTIGIAGAVGAAVTGLTDWQHTSRGARRTGLVHATLNTMALGFYVTSLVLRKNGARSAGRATAFLGYGVVIASAYLGGALVYRERLGVDHADRRAQPEEFTAVFADADLGEGQVRRVDTGGVAVLLVRRGGQVFALNETCSHLGGPLSEGSLEGDSVRCPWHGSRFALEDGRVLDGPATFPQPCFDTRVRNGRIEVRAATR